MALLFIDGFDHYATADITKKWTVLNGSQTVAGTSGRRGTGALSLLSSGYVRRVVGGSNTTLVVGFAFYPTSAGVTNNTTLQLLEGSTQHLSFVLNSSMQIDARRGASTGTSIGTSSAALDLNAWNYLEFKVTIHDTTGAVEVRLNGAAILTLTSVDTRNGGSGYVDTVGIGGGSLTNQSAAGYYDDMYVCDTSGSNNNDFLGDVRIDAIFPNGAGTYQDWTPSTGSDHAVLVDETAPNGTDYLTGGAAGTKETLTLQDLSINGSILGIQVNNAMAKSDAGACTIQNLIRSSTSDANGATFAPSTSYSYSMSIHETNPATGSAWLTAEINALEAGAEVVS